MNLKIALANALLLSAGTADAFNGRGLLGSHMAAGGAAPVPTPAMETCVTTCAGMNGWPEGAMIDSGLSAAGCALVPACTEAVAGCDAATLAMIVPWQAAGCPIPKSDSDSDSDDEAMGMCFVECLGDDVTLLTETGPTEAGCAKLPDCGPGPLCPAAMIEAIGVYAAMGCKEPTEADNAAMEVCMTTCTDITPEGGDWQLPPAGTMSEATLTAAGCEKIKACPLSATCNTMSQMMLTAYAKMKESGCTAAPAVPATAAPGGASLGSTPKASSGAPAAPTAVTTPAPTAITTTDSGSASLKLLSSLVGAFVLSFLAL